MVDSTTPAPAPAADETFSQDAEADLLSAFGFTEPAAVEPVASTPAPAALVVPEAPASLEPVVGAVAAPAPTTVVPPVVPPATPPAPAALAPAPAPATPPAASEEAIRISSLTAQLQAAQTALAKLQQPVAPGTPPAAAPGTVPEAETPPQYGLVVPEAMANALFGEDPVAATNAITHLVNSLAVNIHTKLRTENAERLSALRQEVLAAATQPEEARQQEQMRNDYYADFPNHNSPVLVPIIAQVAGQLAAEYPGASWDKNFIAAVGSRVNAHLTTLGVPPTTPGIPPVPPAVPAGRMPAAPAPHLPAAQPRGGIPAFEDDQQSMVADTFAFR